MPERAISPSSTTPTRFVTRCGLSLCRLDPCPLSTHWAYVERALVTTRRLDGSPSSVTSAPLCEQLLPDQEARFSDPEVLPSTRMIDRCVQHIDRQISDGLPSIPFKTRYVHECCDLIHHHVTIQVYRRLRIYFPYADPPAYIRPLLETAYTNSVMSIVVIGNSQAHKLMLGRAHAADRTTQIVYGIVLRELRDRVKSVLPGDTLWVLRLVMALVGLEFYLNSPTSLKTHREAIQNLVAMRGGIDAVGEIRGYVLNIDRFIATCLGEYPLYRHTNVMRRPVWPVGRYGKAFATRAGTIDPMAIAFLEDQCRLIDMLETGGVRLMDEDESSSLRSIDRGMLPYFLSLREKVSADFANLHAYYHDNQVDVSDPLSVARAICISRCVVLGGFIISYAITLGDFYTMMRPMIGSVLEGIMKGRTRKSWRGNEDTVVWLLFALATIPGWSGHEQVIVELHGWLSSRYIESWPTGDWMAEQYLELKNFVWCDLVFASLYSTICEELSELESKLRSVDLESTSEWRFQEDTSPRS